MTGVHSLSSLRPCFLHHPLKPLRPHLISPVHLVTMQIYLSPHPKRTGSSEIAKSASEVPTNTVADNAQSKEGGRNEANKPPPSFTLNLQKTSSSHRTQQDKSSYKSPTKSPSQYFQICY